MAFFGTLFNELCLPAARDSGIFLPEHCPTFHFPATPTALPNCAMSGKSGDDLKAGENTDDEEVKRRARRFFDTEAACSDAEGHSEGSGKV